MASMSSKGCLDESTPTSRSAFANAIVMGVTLESDRSMSRDTSKAV